MGRKIHKVLTALSGTPRRSTRNHGLDPDQSSPASDARRYAASPRARSVLHRELVLFARPLDLAQDRQRISFPSRGIGPGVSRRVLILAYHYPPEPTSGSLRMAYLSRYLPEFAWEPTVITRTVRGNGHSSANVIRVGCPFATTWVPSNRDAESIEPSPMAGLKRNVKHVLFFPDRAVSWIPHAVRAATRLHRTAPF